MMKMKKVERKKKRMRMKVELGTRRTMKMV
jgi:hypothetical protein